MTEQFDETISVREGESFDVNAVHDYLSQHIQDFPKNSMIKVKQFPTGKSNLTYLLTCGNWEGVLRRPPLGPLPPKAHDMKRESDFLTRLQPAFTLAPKPYVFCDDESVIGAPFYVMERKQGVVINESLPDGVENTVERGRELSELAVDTLVDLHNVDYEAVGLGSFGRPEGFMERQVHGWINRYERSKTDDIPSYEPLAAWLKQHIPHSTDVTVVHNDFKFNNMLFSDDLKQVKALLDWEMSTIGDPMFDLGNALSYWMKSDDPDILTNSFKTVTTMPGFVSRNEFIQLYAERSGRDCSSIHFYQVFAYFKLAVIVQQIYYRWKKGQTQDNRFEHYHKRTKNLTEFAWQFSQDATL